MDKISDLEDRKKLLQIILDVTGGKIDSFYLLQKIIPSFRTVSWNEVELYKKTVGMNQETTEIVSFSKQKVLKFPKKLTNE